MTSTEAPDQVKASPQENQAETKIQVKPTPQKNELREARPLLQAIFLGLLLASGLVAAAAMANPGGKEASEELRLPVELPAGAQATGKTF